MSDIVRRPPNRPLPRLHRREVLTLGVGAFLITTLPRVREHRSRPFVRRQLPIMGTLADVAVVHDDPAVAHAAIRSAFEALQETDRLMSRYRADSDVGRANRTPVGEAVLVDAHTAHVLARALDFARETAGAFDPCLGRAVQLWNVNRRKSPPSADEVRALAGRDLWRALELDVGARGSRVVRRDADVGIDLGGIAKGYGVDRAVTALRAHGVEHGLVNVGGDLYALGRRADGEPWAVGVRDAHDPRRITQTLQVTDEAVATSGDYRQFFDHAGRRYHHLLDPRTGAPTTGQVHSATIVAPTCLAADARATAAFA